MHINEVRHSSNEHFFNLFIFVLCIITIITIITVMTNNTQWVRAKPWEPTSNTVAKWISSSSLWTHFSVSRLEPSNYLAVEVRLLSQSHLRLAHKRGESFDAFTIWYFQFYFFALCRVALMSEIWMCDAFRSFFAVNVISDDIVVFINNTCDALY